MAGKILHSNRDIDLTARRLLLISVVWPTLEYGSEVWEGNKAQAAALESVMIGGAKRILGCLSRTCNEAVRGDMNRYAQLPHTQWNGDIGTKTLISGLRTKRPYTCTGTLTLTFEPSTCLYFSTMLLWDTRAR